MDVAEARVQVEGFTLPKRPGENVEALPEDLTALGDQDLMQAMQKQVAWVEYSGYRLARGEVEEREIDLQISQRVAFMLISGWGGGRGDRVAIAKATAEDDDEIKELREAHMKALAYRKIIQRLYEAAERRVNLVSRELTRRTSMEPNQRRVRKHGGA